MNYEVTMDIYLKINIHIGTIRCLYKNFWKTVYAPNQYVPKISHEAIIPDILIIMMKKETENRFKNQDGDYPYLTWDVKLINGKFKVVPS